MTDNFPEKALDKALEILRSGKTLTVRECSICDHPLDFLMLNNFLYFSPNCNCVNYFTPPNERTIKDLKYYTDQQHFQKIWGLHEKF